MRRLTATTMAIALLGCGGAATTAENGPSATGADGSEETVRRPEAEDPQTPAAAVELSSGAFAFETRPPGVATVVDDERGLYAVVVGIGSPENGARALAAAHGELSGRSADDLAEGFAAANRAVHALRSGDGPAEPGAVAAAVVVDAEGAHLAHVGNVRVYRLRGGELERLTTDHSVVEDYIRTHELSPEEAEELRRSGPHRNAVLRALGPQPEVEVTRRTVAVAPGDTLVLVAAGVHLFVDDALMARLLGEAGPDPEAMARRIVEESADDRSTEPRAAVVVRVR